MIILEQNIDRASDIGWIIISIGMAIAWGAIVLNLPVLLFTSICSAIFGIIGCLIPVYLVYKVLSLHRYKGGALYLIIFTGILLCISPFLKFI